MRRRSSSLASTGRRSEICLCKEDVSNRICHTGTILEPGLGQEPYALTMHPREMKARKIGA